MGKIPNALLARRSRVSDGFPVTIKLDSIKPGHYLSYTTHLSVFMRDGALELELQLIKAES
jgi:hypothetical protein